MLSCCSESGRIAVSRLCVLVELIHDERRAIERDSSCVLVREAAVRSH